MPNNSSRANQQTRVLAGRECAMLLDVQFPEYLPADSTTGRSYGTCDFVKAYEWLRRDTQPDEVNYRGLDGVWYRTRVGDSPGFDRQPVLAGAVFDNNGAPTVRMVPDHGLDAQWHHL